MTLANGSTQQRSESPGLAPGSRGQGGRKGNDGSEEVPDFKTIRDEAKGVLKLLKQAEAVKEKAAKAINALAERTNTNSKNLRRLFKANLKGNLADVRRDIEQTQILFEQVGVIEGATEEVEK